MSHNCFNLLGLQVQALEDMPLQQQPVSFRVELDIGCLRIYWNYPSGSNLTQQLDDSCGVEPWLWDFYPLFRFDQNSRLLKFIFIGERMNTVHMASINMHERRNIATMHLQLLEHKANNWPHVVIDSDKRLLLIGQADVNNNDYLLLMLNSCFALVANQQQHIVGALVDLKIYFGADFVAADMLFLQQFLSIVSCWEQLEDEDNCRQLSSLMQHYGGRAFQPYFDAIYDDIAFILS
jgi:hypothetical protein